MLQSIACSISRFRVGRRMDTGSHLTGALFCYLPPPQVSHLANAIARLQDDRRSMGIQPITLFAGCFPQPVETHQRNRYSNHLTFKIAF